MKKEFVAAPSPETLARIMRQVAHQVRADPAANHICGMLIFCAPGMSPALSTFGPIEITDNKEFLALVLAECVAMLASPSDLSESLGPVKPN